MRAFLAVSVDPGPDAAPRLSTAVAAARRLAPEALPYPPAVGREASWVSPVGTAALLAWTNEPEDPLLPPLLRVTAEGAYGHTGYLAVPSDDERLADAVDLGAQVERTGGCFAVFRARTDGIDAANTISRVDPVYVGRAPGVALAGSRAFLVHLVSRAIETGAEHPDPEYDLLAMHWIARQAFFVSEDTPFKGVAPLPAASTLHTVGTREKVTSRPIEPGSDRGRAETDAEIDDLADAVLRAVEPVRRHREPPNLALSGGRDSRMLAAALHAARIPFTASTRGFPDHPDVIVARQVAAALRVPHTVGDPRRGATSDRLRVEHPLERAHRVVWISEGMNSAYDDLVGFASFRVVARLSGSGGEIIRGGFLCSQSDVADAALRARIDRMFTAALHLFVPEANERARLERDRWRAAPGGPAEVLASLYLLYRAGRWLVGPRTATLLNGISYHPFLDNLVVQRASRLPAMTRWGERPAHGLITRLAPELKDLPIEGRRWHYEGRLPPALTEIPGWLRRHAVTPRGPTSRFDYRRGHDRAFADILRDAVMDGPSELFDVVHRTEAEKLFAKAPAPTMVWRLLAMSVLLSGSWRRGAWRPFGSVEVPLPPS